MGSVAEFSANKDDVEKWLVYLSRLGYAAKGVVYLIIGILGLEAVWGYRSANVQRSQVLTEIASQPFGMVLLWIMAIGLVGYVIWRWIQAFKDPEHNGTDAKGIAQRIGYFVSGLTYAVLALLAFRIILGSGGGSSGSGSSIDKITATVMQNPIGRWTLILVGVIIAAAGVYQFYRAYDKKFLKHLKLNEMKKEEREFAIRLGQFGISARGVVMILVGSFLVQAAWQFDPNKAGGLGKAFQTLASQPTGPWLLGIVALGFLSFGLFAIMLARYRYIKVD